MASRFAARHKDRAAKQEAKKQGERREGIPLVKIWRAWGRDRRIAGVRCVDHER
jgi:hypothetical protein